MAKIWGFDLGTASIGWSIIEESDDQRHIIGMGSRIIPQTDADSGNKGAFAQFVTGNAISKNAERTQRRTLRKGYDRYQMRRETLRNALKASGMLPDDTCSPLDKTALWSLRSRAASERITLPELGRVLMHLNQKRGYKSARAEGNTKEETDYVQRVLTRHQQLQAAGLTIGQYLCGELSGNSDFRVRDLIYPRAAYIEEFDRIVATQRTHYPAVLTDTLVRRLRDEIIYRQRPLKSCKGLVAVCEFEGRKQTLRGNEVLCGPKVAPRTSPLAQACRTWEQINNITITDKSGAPYPLTLEEKQLLFSRLDVRGKLSWTEIQKLLGIKKSDGWSADQKVTKSGLQGNETRAAIAAAFGPDDIPDGLLDFPLIPAENNSTAASTALLYDHKTGEVLCEEAALCIAPEVEQAPLHQLWHTIYSIADMDECAAALVRKFEGITPAAAGRLAAIDFTRQGFGNKSAKAMRRILPYLMLGYRYSEAMGLAGYNHSGFLTRDQRQAQSLKERLDLLPKNALRQPVVEKILNQLINLSNALLTTYGRPDQIRVELARELKQSQDQRNKADKAMRDNERNHKRIAARIQSDYPGVRATRRTIQKYKLYEELSAIGSVCIYCGRPITLAEALSGDQVDVEHIIPQSQLFDDSQSNKTLSHQSCNRLKGNMTAYDYMSAKPAGEFAAYQERVELLGKHSHTKRNKLLMPSEKIPTDFIDRQLRQSQYIARKAVELLSDICTEVWTTSGSVTAYLRRVWGWDDTLMNLQLPRYRDIEGATEWVEYQHSNQTHHAERIVGWTKRDDHRHHAIDALVIACTRQGYIQRLNTLSREGTRSYFETSLSERPVVRKPDGDRYTLAERYFASECPFTTAEVMEHAAGILVSFKAGKRVATPGVRKAGPRGERHVAQRVLVPRGPLSEESVYGRIIDPATSEPAYVIRYKLNGDFTKVDKIVDPILRALVQARLDESGGKAKEAFSEPLLWDGVPVRSVRCYTGLKTASVEAVRYDLDTAAPIGFVMPGNNHHIAFYTDPDGKQQCRIYTFWHTVERKRLGLPVIIRRPDLAWELVESDMARFTPSFLEKLPHPEWNYAFSLQQNEMVLLGLDPDIAHAAIEQQDYSLLGLHLYRMRGMTGEGNSMDIWFLHQYETQPQKTTSAQTAKRSYRITSYKRLEELHPVKVRIDTLGRITLVEEP